MTANYKMKPKSKYVHIKIGNVQSTSYECDLLSFASAT